MAHAVLLAGLPNTIGGVTINRYCASGITAMAMADRIRVGEADVMIAAGAESMSMVPMMGNQPSININAFKDENVGMAYGMGLTAEKVAQQWKVSREAQDAFSLASHQKAIAAQQAGEFADEMTRSRSSSASQPGHRRDRHQDPHRRPGRRSACRHQPGTGQAQAVFAAKGSVTAGNSSQMSDGAGALILVSEKILKQFNLTPLARFVSFACAACRRRSWASVPRKRFRRR
jgi:acetyl-CoA acyltransferase